MKGESLLRTDFLSEWSETHTLTPLLFISEYNIGKAHRFDMNGTYQPTVYTEVQLLAKQMDHKETRLETVYSIMQNTEFQFIKIACGRFIH
jgi:hypothetical protein